MNFSENMSIGKRFSQLRKNAGLTQKDVAERLDKPQSYISKIESGERAVHLCEVQRLSESLDRAPGEFVYYVLNLPER